MMRKTRDYDAELKALGDKARALKVKKVQQLGELVTSTGADALDLDTLAGALLAAVESASTAQSARSCDFGHVEERRLNMASYQARSCPPIS